MHFFARLNPLNALRDLRLFLRQRQKHELIFFVVAIALTWLILMVFAKDSNIVPEYRPKIIYVEQWRLDRTDAQIRAQQAIDGPIKQKAIDDLNRRRAERQAQFKRLDDKLTSWGF
jgi:hypothetical protein